MIALVIVASVGAGYIVGRCRGRRIERRCWLGAPRTIAGGGLSERLGASDTPEALRLLRGPRDAA